MTQAEMDVQKLKEQFVRTRDKGRKIIIWTAAIGVILSIVSFLFGMQWPWIFLFLPACAWYARYLNSLEIYNQVRAMEYNIYMTEYYGSRADEQDRP